MDRNVIYPDDSAPVDWSLSARRAWIEIIDYNVRRMKEDVALRKESVDRNALFDGNNMRTRVALRKESVDRNSNSGY